MTEVDVSKVLLSDVSVLTNQHPRAGRIKLAAPAVSYDGEKPAVSLPILDALGSTLMWIRYTVHHRILANIRTRCSESSAIVRMILPS